MSSRSLSAHLALWVPITSHYWSPRRRDTRKFFMFIYCREKMSFGIFPRQTRWNNVVQKSKGLKTLKVCVITRYEYFQWKDFQASTKVSVLWQAKQMQIRTSHMNMYNLTPKRQKAIFFYPFYREPPFYCVQYSVPRNRMENVRVFRFRCCELLLNFWLPGVSLLWKFVGRNEGENSETYFLE